MIYVLLLQEGKFYVGHTARPIGPRFIEHFNSNASRWTTLYRPVAVLKILPGGLTEENQLTIELMDKYGWYNVRGGSWCQVEMDSCPRALLEYRKLKVPKPIRQEPTPERHKHDKRPCSRCGRMSHFTNQCYAKSTITGEPLFPSDSESSDYSAMLIEEDWCHSCGERSKCSEECTAFSPDYSLLE